MRTLGTLCVVSRSPTSGKRQKYICIFVERKVKCKWVWKTKPGEKNNVYLIKKNATVFFITCQEIMMIYRKTFILRMVWRKGDTLSLKWWKTLAGLYCGRNKIRQLKTRGSESRRRRRRRRRDDVKQGYGKLRYYREKREESERYGCMTVNRERKRDKVRKSFFLPISSFQSNR